MKLRRTFTRDFKLSVLKDLELRPLVEVCRVRNVDPSVVRRWRVEFAENPKEAFSGYGRPWKENARISRYERLVGQLYAENAFLNTMRPDPQVFAVSQSPHIDDSYPSFLTFCAFWWITTEPDGPVACGGTRENKRTRKKKFCFCFEKFVNTLLNDINKY